MADEKRVKKFSNIDDLLLSPGNAMIYMDRLRTEVYHMQKKLRRQAYRIKFQELELEDADEVMISATRLMDNINQMINAEAVVSGDGRMLKEMISYMMEEEQIMIAASKVSNEKEENLRKKYHK